MTQKKIVLALGGNALQKRGLPATAETQLQVARETAECIADIVVSGYELVIVHGNGPQVGNIVLASETAAATVPVMPLDVCGAMSQGYIGYHIQQALQHALFKRTIYTPVVTMVTQVVVDKNDPAFDYPTKPIGPFYSKEEALELAASKGYHVKEDAGRGWRRVVASPEPQRIVELSSLKLLWGKAIVIAAGGGGIPVIEPKGGQLEGVAAVIDKDLVAARLASDLDVDTLMILTEVEKASTNFNRSGQNNLGEITAKEAERYAKEGHFAPGSMLPKIQAALNFVKKKPGGRAVITSLYKAREALEGKTGTVITEGEINKE